MPRSGSPARRAGTFDTKTTRYGGARERLQCFRVSTPISKRLEHARVIYSWRYTGSLADACGAVGTTTLVALDTGLVNAFEKPGSHDVEGRWPIGFRRGRWWGH